LGKRKIQSKYTLDTGGGDIRDFVFDLNIPEDTLRLGGGGFAITSGTGISAIRFEDGRRHQFTVAGFAQGAERDLKAISGDVEYKISKGPFVGLKFGGRYEDEAADVYRNFIDFVDLPNPFTEFNQSLQNARNGSDARRNFARDLTFNAERENTELFGMVKYDFAENYDTFPVRGNFGLRYIKTDLSGLAEGLDEPGEGSYEEFLPSANVIADLSDNVVFQAAYYKTFEAFNLAEFRPTAATVSPAIPNPDAENPENALGTLSINESNLPFCTAGFISQIDSPDAQAEIGGRTPFLDSAGNCRLDSGGGLGPRLNLSQFTNTDPIRVNGIEFQVSQNTDFLDGFWGNFGGTFNYTYTTANSGEGFVLPRVSRNTYNIIGYYETEKFSIRLAQNYRSAYNLEAGGSFQGRERQVRARTQLDLSATYNPRKDIQFRVQAFNLNNSLREEFEGFDVLGRRTDYDGRTYTFSVQKRF